MGDQGGNFLKLFKDGCAVREFLNETFQRLFEKLEHACLPCTVSYGPTIMILRAAHAYQVTLALKFSALDGTRINNFVIASLALHERSTKNSRGRKHSAGSPLKQPTNTIIWPTDISPVPIGSSYK